MPILTARVVANEAHGREFVPLVIVAIRWAFSNFVHCTILARLQVVLLGPRDISPIGPWTVFLD